jgi:hypothetical protein
VEYLSYKEESTVDYWLLDSWITSTEESAFMSPRRIAICCPLRDVVMRERGRVNHAKEIKRELDMHCVLPGWHAALAVKKNRMNE